jgi:hypothetical protein
MVRRAKLSLHNGVAPEPLRIRVDREAYAIALGRDLSSLGTVDLRPYGLQWELALHGPKTDRVVNRVLEAVRRTLDGQVSDVAEIILDGRTYRMQGEEATG